MATAVKPIPTQSYRAKVTSKGQITVPVEIRRSLGVKPGDKIRLLFLREKQRMQANAVLTERTG